MKKIIITLLASLSLQSCIFVAGAAAGAAGVAVVYDHRKIEQIGQDQQIVNQANEKIYAIQSINKDSHIDVTSFNNVVLLTGQTPLPAIREEAEKLIRTVPNIKEIYNEISIKGPTSSLTRASDTWITTKIKTQMLATKGLSSSSIKVLTENGTVYLMGSVDNEQGEIAVSIARKVSGVQRVLKIFEYIDEVQNDNAQDDITARE